MVTEAISIIIIIINYLLLRCLELLPRFLCNTYNLYITIHNGQWLYAVGKRGRGEGKRNDKLCTDHWQKSLIRSPWLTDDGLTGRCDEHLLEWGIRKGPRVQDIQSSRELTSAWFTSYSFSFLALAAFIIRRLYIYIYIFGLDRPAYFEMLRVCHGWSKRCLLDRLFRLITVYGHSTTLSTTRAAICKQ